MKRTCTAIIASIGLAFACMASTPATANAAVAHSYAIASQHELAQAKQAGITAATMYEKQQTSNRYAATLVRGAVNALKAYRINQRRERAARAAALAAQTQQTPAALPAVSYSGGGIWSCIAQYESGGDWSINTGNGYYGGLQFTEGSWLGYGGGSYAQYASEATPSQQIAVAVKLQAAQGWGAWPVSSVKCGV